MSEVTIHNIGSEYMPNIATVYVSRDQGLVAEYFVLLAKSDSTGRSWNLQPELFMMLSEVSHRKYGDCTIYQLEMESIVAAFAKGELEMEFPCMLGATQYCKNKPNAIQTTWNRIRSQFMQLKWKMGIGRQKRWDEPPGSVYRMKE